MITREEYRQTLRELVFSLLSRHEMQIVKALLKADRPLSMGELHDEVCFSYRTLKRLVKRLDEKRIVSGYRDAVKIVTLNELLAEERE